MRISLFASLLALGSAFAQGGDSPSPPSEAHSVEADYLLLFKKANDLLTAKRPAEALDCCITKIIDFYLAEEQANPKVRFYSAKTQAETLHYLLEAAKEKKDSRVVSALYSHAYYVQAFAYIDLGRNAEARVAIEQALRLSPRNSQFLAERAHQFALAKEWRASLSGFIEAESAARQLSDEKIKTGEICRALRGQGYALAELQRLREAEKAYLSCLELSSSDGKAVAELGYVRVLMAKERP
jgi:tetratricopeptide (TPR) repeat protein